MVLIKKRQNMKLKPSFLFIFFKPNYIYRSLVSAAYVLVS